MYTFAIVDNAGNLAAPIATFSFSHMSNENLFNHCHGKKTFPSPQSVRQERQDEKRTMPLAHIPTIKK